MEPNYEIPKLKEELDGKIKNLLNQAEEWGKKHGNNSNNVVPQEYVNVFKRDFQSLDTQLRQQAFQHLGEYKNAYEKKQEELQEYEKLAEKNTNHIQEQILLVEKERDRLIQNVVDNYHHAKLPKVGEDINTLNSEIEAVENRFAEASRKIEQYKLDNLIDVRWGIVIICLLTFLEIPFTYSAFLILKTTPVVSLSISILLSIVLAFSAHFAGVSIKRKKYLTASILMLISLASIQVASHFRTLHANNESLDFDSWFAPEDIFFLIIGSVIYFICTAISFFAHSSNDQSVKAHREYKLEKLNYKRDKIRIQNEINELEQKRADLNKELYDKKQEIEKEFEEKIKQVRKGKEKILQERRDTAMYYNRALGYYKEIESELNEKFHHVVSEYKTMYTRMLSVAAPFKLKEQESFINSKPEDLEMPINKIPEIQIP